tara:strand:+ start:56 stop:532 length:477 start_codon:yes stop_codon:yes gene_type:complete
MNIYKNFLSKDEFNKIETTIMGNMFPWFFNDGLVTEKDKFFQFTFTFVRENKNNCHASIMSILNPILDKIKYKRMERIKANLLPRTEKLIEHHFHSDFPNVKTGIYYLNNCNGYTKFKNGKKIKSEKNKYIEFDSNLKHTGSTCTDAKRRVVINFNYV